MTLRILVAAVVTAALLAVSLPALDATRRAHTDTTVEREVDRLETAIRDVHTREAAVRNGAPGARRVVTVRLPAESWYDTGVDRVSVGHRPEETDGQEIEASGWGQPAIRWQVSDGPGRSRHIDGVQVVGYDRDGTTSLVLEEPGAHRLAVTLVELDGTRVVSVRRLD